jgi:hypothetical protein
VAVYDLLLLGEHQAQIIDWKTYLQPKQNLDSHWQTRLYLYLLAETSHYQPEDLSMTYWFVKIPHKPQHVTYAYNRAKHEQTKQDLISLLNQLSSYLNQSDFPHRHDCEQSCPHRADFDFPEQNSHGLAPDLDAIEEVII